PNVEHVGPQAFYKTDTVRPCFKIEVGWWCGWTYIIDTWQAYPGHISREQFPRMRIKKDHVVHCMSWSIVNLQTTPCNLEDIAALDDLYAIFWYRFNLSPQQLHTVAINTRCARHYLRRIKQMWSAFSMYKDPCPRQTADQ